MPQTHCLIALLALAAVCRAAPVPDSARGRDQLTDTVRYEADIITYDMQQRVIHLNNHAVTHYQDVTLRADTIVYRIDVGVFEAFGSPRLDERGDVTVGERLTYNIKTRRGSVSYATAQTGGDYFTGQTIVKSAENHLYIREGDYTSCAYLEHPHYSFYGRNIKVIPKDKAVSRPVVMNIGEAPVAAFPYYIMPLDRGRTSGFLMPGWGGHPTSGGYLDNVGYYWVPNDYMDYLLAAKVQEFNNFVLTGRARYAKRYWLNGSISADYRLGTTWERNSQQWALSYSHNQKLLPDGSFTLIGNGNLASQRVDNKTYYQANSEVDNDIIRQDLTANLALQKRIERLNTSVSLGWSRNQNLLTDHIAENIPTLDFSLPNRPIIPPRTTGTTVDGGTAEAKWYNRIYCGYGLQGRVHREEWLNDSLPGWVKPALGQTLTISSPQTIFKYFTINPSFNTRLSSFYGCMDADTSSWDTLRQVRRDTFDIEVPIADSLRHRDGWVFQPHIDTLLPDDFSDTTDTNYVLTWLAEYPDSFPVFDTFPERFANDFDWNAGVSLSTNIYGLFPFHILNFAGLRHTMTPSVSYTYSPSHHQDYRFYPVGITGAATRKESQKIGFSLRNVFQGKFVRPTKAGEAQQPQESKPTLLTLDLGTAYDFEAPVKRWSDLSLSAGTDLKLMRVNYTSAFWFYDHGDQGGKLTWPILRSYGFAVTPNNFSVGGRFWDGDLLVLNRVQPWDPVEYRTAGNQQWRLGLAPAFNFSSSRRTPDDFFVSTKSYSLSASASLAFTRHWALSWNSTYDFVKNRFASHALNFLLDLECWDLVFNWTPAGVRPGYYYFRVNIKKVPDIKWEERQ